MLTIIRKPIVQPIERIELTQERGIGTLIITRSRKTPGGITFYTKHMGQEGQVSITVTLDQLPVFLAAVTELVKVATVLGEPKVTSDVP